MLYEHSHRIMKPMDTMETRLFSSSHGSRMYMHSHKIMKPMDTMETKLFSSSHGCHMNMHSHKIMKPLDTRFFSPSHSHKIMAIYTWVQPVWDWPPSVNHCFVPFTHTNIYYNKNMLSTPFTRYITMWFSFPNAYSHFYFKIKIRFLVTFEM